MEDGKGSVVNLKNSLGTAGFVLALIGLFTGWIPVLGWIVWILGAVFSVIGLFKRPKGLAIAGTIISAVGVVLLIIFATLGSSIVDEASKELNKQSETVDDNSSKEKEVKASFKNDTITQSDGSKIKFTGSEVMNDFDSKPMLVVLFDYTNNSNEGQNLQLAFLDSVNAYQKLDSTTEDLTMAIPDMNFKYQDRSDKLDADVNPGSTVQGVYTYEIKDTSKPVVLEFKDGMLGEELGTKEYTIK